MSAMTHLRVDSRYDQDHDILYIIVGAPEPSVYEENFPGILIRQSKRDASVTGAVVMSFSRQTLRLLQEHVPIDLDWESLRRKHLGNE